MIEQNGPRKGPCSLENKVDEEYQDEDGYPTEAALQRIEHWDVKDPMGCFEFIKSLWRWENGFEFRTETPAEYVNNSYTKRPDATWARLATGGWSGNEALIRALDRSVISWATWCQSSRGGLHIYRIPSQDEWLGKQTQAGLQKKEEGNEN